MPGWPRGPSCQAPGGRTRHAESDWNGHVVAESDQFEEVEGYFPPEALKRELVRPSERTTVCGWKGTARYFDLVAGDQVAANAVWTYPDPKPAAANIKDYVAFYCPPVRIDS